MKADNNMIIFKKYFSDLFILLLVLLFLFGVALLLSFTFVPNKYFALIVPILILLLALLYIDLIIYCIRVRIEMNKTKQVTKRIIVTETFIDKRFNLRNNGGVLVGDLKMVIKDENGTKYRIMLANSDKFWMAKDVVGKAFDITYLSKTTFILKLYPCITNTLSRDDKEFHKTVNILFKDYYTR